MSSEDLQRSRAAAELVGAHGEELVSVRLARMVTMGELSSFEWTSSVNAIAPYDFRIMPAVGTPRLIDSKSTSSGFLNPIHLSLGEIWTAVEGPEPYDIYRVFNVTESSAALRIAYDVGPGLRSMHPPKPGDYSSPAPSVGSSAISLLESRFMLVAWTSAMRCSAAIQL
jgi:hypothetical protein